MVEQSDGMRAAMEARVKREQCSTQVARQLVLATVSVVEEDKSLGSRRISSIVSSLTGEDPSLALRELNKLERDKVIVADPEYSCTDTFPDHRYVLNPDHNRIEELTELATAAEIPLLDDRTISREQLSKQVGLQLAATGMIRRAALECRQRVDL